MYKKIEGSPSLIDNEICVKYPDNFILIRRDTKGLNIIGKVLFIGDDYDELSDMIPMLDEPSRCIVIEGINYRRSLGGLVVNG